MQPGDSSQLELGRELDRLDLPYFIPQDKKLLALPAVVN